MKKIGIFLFFLGIVLGIRACNADTQKSVRMFGGNDTTLPTHHRDVDDPLLLAERQRNLVIWSVVSLGGGAMIVIAKLRERESE